MLKAMKKKGKGNKIHIIIGFLIHSGMKKDAQFFPSHSQSEETMEKNLDNKSENYEEDLCDYDIWFKKHTGLLLQKR